MTTKPKEDPVDHVAFTLNNALEWHEAGWISWDELEREVAQASTYFHWLYDDAKER